MKKFIIVLIIIIIAGIGTFLYSQGYLDTLLNRETTEETPEDIFPVTGTQEGNMNASTTAPQNNAPEVVIGESVGGRDIMAYNFGTGDTRLLFVGGIHGGYEWNTVLVAYELMDYLKANPSAIPENVKVTVIPNLNPDGTFKTVGKEGRFTAANVPSSQTTQVAGRYNANDVDLNRNFDCDWKPTGKWQNKTVNAGSAPFSEPESAAFRDFVMANRPSAVIAYYSAAGGVYASNCLGSVSAETRELTNKYAAASGYRAYEDFDYYELNGDMVNWIAKSNIPGISILLTNHTSTEWTKNKAGVDAILKHFAR